MLDSIGPWQIIIVVLLIVLLFGRGKISEMMGDVAKGINSFKKGLKEDPEKAITHDTSKEVVKDVKDQSKVS